MKTYTAIMIEVDQANKEAEESSGELHPIIYGCAILRCMMIVAAKLDKIEDDMYKLQKNVDIEK